MTEAWKEEDGVEILEEEAKKVQDRTDPKIGFVG